MNSINFNQPLKISNIDVNNIVYSKIKKASNKKIILTKYNRDNFVFQTPTLLTLPKTSTTSLEIALVGKEKGKVNKFTNFLNNLERKVKLDAQMNAPEWFNLLNNTINFQRLARDSDNYQYGTLKIKLINTPDFKTRLELNVNGVHKKIDYSQIPEYSWCKMILECYAIWINPENDFGIFLRPILLSFTQREDILYNYNFVDSESDNELDVLDTEITSHLNMTTMSSHVLGSNVVGLNGVGPNVVGSNGVGPNVVGSNVVGPNVVGSNEVTNSSIFIKPYKNNIDTASQVDIETLVNHLELETSQSNSTVSSKDIRNVLDDNMVQNDIISSDSSSDDDE